MKKSVLFFAFFTIVGHIGVAQNDPTIDAIYFEEGNNFCNDGSYYTLVVEVTDLDGDAVSISSLVFANNYLDYFSGSPVTVGNTTTFYYDVFVNFSNAPAVGTVEPESLNVSVISSSGIDPTSADSDVLTGLAVNGEVFAEFSVFEIWVCDNGLPIDLNQYVTPAGGEFSWADNYQPYTYSNSNALDPKKAYQVFLGDGGDGFYVDYYVTNVNGCLGYANASVEFYNAPTINMVPTSSTCGNADGSAVATITGGTAPYNAYWSTGKTESVSGTTNITNASSGVYYLNITDVNGCKAVENANISDSDLSVSSVITERKCLGQNGSVDLNIIPSTGTVESIFWSNGHTTPTLSAGPGEYSVNIHTSANCNFFGTYEIPDSALNVKLEDSYPNFNCLTTPSGYIDITTSGGDGAYNWAWEKNGIAGFATTQDLFSIQGGVYKCTVTDGAGCSLTWSKTIENSSNVWLWTDAVTQPTCGNSDGSIDIEIDPTGDTPSFYEWSNGTTAEDLTGLPEGNYTLTFTDQAGCTNYLTVKLTNQKPYQPSVCLLTVDTSLIYNMVVWEKDITQNIAGYNIYRETSVYGEFEKVATRPYTLESFFQDNAASPVDRSWRYYITTFDACGGESYGSFIHKTIHVVANTSNGVDYTLNWDNYEGIAYSTIDLFRFDNVNGWVVAADDLPYGTNTFDDTPPVIGGLDYMVSFNLTDPCTSSKAQDHNSSRSNKTASVFSGGGSTVQVEDEDLGIISIYPNPANEMLTLHVDNPELFQVYEITDLNGRVVASGSILAHNTQINLSEIQSGVYLIRLVSEDKIVVNKFVKN